MAVHIFVVDESNYEICIRRGLAAIPDSDNPNTMDGLISRMTMVRKGDYVLFYITLKKKLRGIFRVLDAPFYDKAEVWPVVNNQYYPLRVRIENSRYVFPNPIRLSDIYDLRDRGKVWTFALKRPGFGSRNVMFSISSNEFEELFNLYLKLNPIYGEPHQIEEPYRYCPPNLLNYLSIDRYTYIPKYEYTLMSLLSDGLAKGRYKNIFGDYSDYLCYVPTSFDKEIDVLLAFAHPENCKQIIAYNIIELKKDRFDEMALGQLLQYEDWFLRKKVNGDSCTLRTTAIAKRFDIKVITYLRTRKLLENKYVMLLEYRNTQDGLEFKPIEY